MAKNHELEAWLERKDKKLDQQEKAWREAGETLSKEKQAQAMVRIAASLGCIRTKDEAEEATRILLKDKNQLTPEEQSTLRPIRMVLELHQKRVEARQAPGHAHHQPFGQKPKFVRGHRHHREEPTRFF